jgi:hypothetical protein
MKIARSNDVFVRSVIKVLSDLKIKANDNSKEVGLPVTIDSYLLKMHFVGIIKHIPLIFKV